MLTVRDVAARLAKSEWWVRQQATTGAIPAFKIGEEWRFDEDEFKRWQQAQRFQPTVIEIERAPHARTRRRRATGSNVIDLVNAARKAS